MRSVFEQTHRPIELIVIDDASPDDTPNIIQRLSKLAPIEVRFVAHTENKGASASLNEALALARGSYVGVLASDDAWQPTKVAQQLAVLSQGRFRAVLGDSIIIDEHDHVIGHQCVARLKNEPDSAEPVTEVSFLDLAFGLASPTTQSGLFETDLLRDVGAWTPGVRTEDLDLMLRVTERATVACLHLPLLRYRSTATGANRRVSPTQDDEQERILASHLERFRRLGVSWDEVMFRLWLRRARFHKNLGGTREALDSALKALRLKPLSLDAYYLVLASIAPRWLQSIQRRIRHQP